MRTVTEERCFFCNHEAEFILVRDGMTALEIAMCNKCHAPLRANDVMKVIYDRYTTDLKEESLFKNLQSLKILNTANKGYIHEAFCHLPGYICSEYFEGIPNGQMESNGCYCVDLCNIPFQSESFDLIISEHVFEHVPDAKAAFSEIARVLKPGGVHLFSIPYSEGLERTRHRKGYAPFYHASLVSSKGALVHYEYGKDLCEFSKTPTTFTKLVSHRMFYHPDEVTDLENLRSKKIKSKDFDRLMFEFKYNPVVFAQGKCALETEDDYKYDTEFSPDASRNQFLIKNITPGSVVLEFGCHTGRLTKYLKEELGCSVYIVEYDEKAYKVAIQYAKLGVCGDIMDYTWLNTFTDIQFDAVIFADVLEHLMEPLDVLKAVGQLLKPEGQILVSIPNVAHNSILLNLFNNEFNYTEVGLLDKTHIRFFAQKNLKPFFQKAGYDIVLADNVIVPYTLSEQFRGINFYNRELYHLLSERDDGDVYQYVLLLKKIQYIEKHQIQCVTYDKVSQGSYNLSNDSKLYGKCYLDKGEGFNEENVILSFGTYHTISNGIDAIFRIKIEQEVKNVRFDLQSSSCILTNLGVYSEIGKLSFRATNGIMLTDYLIFENEPQIMIGIDGRHLKFLEIRMRIIYDEKQLYTFLREVLNTSSWKATAPIREAKNILKTVRVNYFSKVKQYNDLRYYIDNMNMDNRSLYLEGWIFSQKGMIKSIQIEAQHKNHRVKAGTIFHLVREDCFQTFQSEYARKSGFKAEIIWEDVSELIGYKIYCKCYMEDGNKVKILLGRIKEPIGKYLKDSIKRYQLNEKSHNEIFQLKNKSTIVFDIDSDYSPKSFIYELRMKAHKKGHGFALIQYEKYKEHYIYHYWFDELEIKLKFYKEKQLFEFLEKQRVRKIYINQLNGYPLLNQLYILKLKEKKNAALTFFVHDSAIILNPKLKSQWEEFFNNCNTIRCFSHFAADKFQNIYGEMNNLKVHGYEKRYLGKVIRPYKFSNSIQIGVIDSKKSKREIVKMLFAIENSKINMNIIYFGKDELNITHQNYKQISQYTPESLPFLMVQHDIDLLYIPASKTELYSFVVQYGMELDMPIVCTEFTAASEQVRDYQKCLVLNKIEPEEKIKEISHFIKDKLPTYTPYGRILFVSEFDDMTSRFRVTHFMEQLGYLGVSSEHLLLEQVETYILKDYDAVVIFRIRYCEKLKEFIQSAKKRGLPVLFGIDDFLFSYQEIEDYASTSVVLGENFKELIKSYYDSMNLCDAYILSTETLARETRKIFKGKTAIVNRNVASAEMLSLSLKAKKRAVKKAGQVVIGYYCSAITHTFDFKTLEDVLERLMEEYDYLHLKIAGPFEEIEKFKKFKDRVHYYKQRDFRELPELLASFDIILMPIIESLLHQCISENKWMETGLVGAVAVASDTEELTRVIQHGKTGLISKTQEDWYENISKLITDTAYREELSRNVHEYVLENYVAEKTGKEAKDFILKLIVKNAK